MGMPGAGKGKQSELLSEKTGFTVYSTGSELRKLVTKGGALGQNIEKVMFTGGNTPAWLATYLFQRPLIEGSPEECLVFEGVGRRESEAKLFPEVCQWLNRDFRVLNLIISEDTARKRLNKRREIEGRKDDAPEILEKRLENFYKDTVPSLEYLRSIGKVIDIDGEPLPDEVSKEVWEKISNL